MITNVEVDGYRLLDGFKAEFRRLNVVIGANASGKSTLSDLILFIAQCADAPLRDVVSYHGGVQSISSAKEHKMGFGWKLRVTKPIFNELWRNTVLPDGREFSYEVEIEGDQASGSYGEPIAVVEVLKEFQSDNSADSQVYLQSSGGKTSIFDSKTKALTPFDEKTNIQNSELIRDPSTAPPATPPQNTTLRLAQMRFFNEYPVPSLIRSLISNFGFYGGFDVGKLGGLRQKPSDIRPETMLNFNGDNLGAVLHELFTRYSYISQRDEFKDFLKAAYPSVKDITAETGYGTPPKVLVRVQEEGMSRGMELWDLSDGMLRFLCLAAALLNPYPAVFIAIDEPEAGFHPRLLPIIADMIKTASERSQILVTTHSPDLLNRFEIADVAVMARDQNHAVWTRPSDRKALERLLKNVRAEVTLGELLRSGELETLP